MRGFYYRFLGIVRRGRSREEHGRWWHAPGRNVADRADLNYGFLSPGRHFSRLHFCEKKKKKILNTVKSSRLWDSLLFLRSTFPWPLVKAALTNRPNRRRAVSLSCFYSGCWRRKSLTGLFSSSTLKYPTLIELDQFVAACGTLVEVFPLKKTRGLRLFGS